MQRGALLCHHKAYWVPQTTRCSLTARIVMSYFCIIACTLQNFCTQQMLPLFFKWVGEVRNSFLWHLGFTSTELSKSGMVLDIDVFPVSCVAMWVLLANSLLRTTTFGEVREVFLKIRRPYNLPPPVRIGGLDRFLAPFSVYNSGWPSVWHSIGFLYMFAYLRHLLNFV